MADTDFVEIERLADKLRRDPKSRMFAQLADAYRKAGMCDEALEVLKTGLEVHPNYATAHLVLARCYVDKHMHEMAKDAAKKLLQLDPQSLVGFKLLAQTCDRLGDEDGLIAAYKGITGLDSSDAPTRAKLQELLKKKTSQDVLTSLSLAKEYETQGYTEKALDIYRRLSYQDPGDIEMASKVKELLQKVTKPGEKKLEALPVDGLETITAFAPPTEAKPEEKLGKLPPLEEILPVEPAGPLLITEPLSAQLGAVEPAVERRAPPKIADEPRVVEPPQVVDLAPVEEPKPVEDLERIVQELPAAEPARPEPQPEVTPLETLLEKAEPAGPPVVEPAKPVEEPQQLVEEELHSLDQFLAPAEEKLPEVKAEEALPSLDGLLKAELPPEQPAPQPKPEVRSQPQPTPQPIEEKASDRPKGDDFQSFQEWLSGLLK